MSQSLAVPHQLDIFTSRLPHKPYCTDELAIGIKPRCKSHAVKKRYIQHNPPPLLAYLIFDVDRPESSYAWNDAGLPPPTWVAVNPDNGHSHIAYGLIAPVCRTEAGKAEPLRFAAAIEFAMTLALDADSGYAGLITKNPIHAHWHTFYPATEASNYGLYELAELAEYVDLPKKLPRKAKTVGVGRNISAFDSLRKWSYSAVRDYWKPNGYNAWQNGVFLEAQKINNFPDPLPISEIKAIAKSVAKWTWQNMTPSGFQDYIEQTHTADIQAVRGKRSGQSRAIKAIANATKSQEMKNEGMSNAEIAKAFGVHRNTVTNWLSMHSEPISDNSPLDAAF